MYVLGISCFYHDAAACLIKDGVIVAAAEEERFTRKKHDIRFPINAINYCLKEAKKKMVALANTYSAFTGWYPNRCRPRLCFKPIYICFILNKILLIPIHTTQKFI